MLLWTMSSFFVNLDVTCILLGEMSTRCYCEQWVHFLLTWMEHFLFWEMSTWCYCEHWVHFIFWWTSVVGSPITDDSTTNYLPHIAGCMPSKWQATSYDHIGNHWQIFSPANWEGCFEFPPKEPPSSLPSITLPLTLLTVIVVVYQEPLEFGCRSWRSWQPLSLLAMVFGQSGVRLPWPSRVLGQKGHSLDVLQLQSSLNNSYSQKGCHNNLLSDSLQLFLGSFWLADLKIPIVCSFHSNSLMCELQSPL
jgi:hypothetical protein